tara:strand:+ start:106 stop:444 length:339 start_codon:yes stop_codon:yes gene_type:complete
MSTNVKKLNIDKNFKKKLEKLYTKQHINNVENKNVQNKVKTNLNNIKKTLQPQQNVFLGNNLEKIYEIDKSKLNNIIITIEIKSYYQLLSYIFFSIFSICLSLRIMYILFLL